MAGCPSRPLGKRGTFLFSFFEAFEDGPPLRINWPEACNNALSYHLQDGWQSFESFYPMDFGTLPFTTPERARLI